MAAWLKTGGFDLVKRFMRAIIGLFKEEDLVTIW